MSAAGVLVGEEWSSAAVILLPECPHAESIPQVPNAHCDQNRSHQPGMLNVYRLSFFTDAD